MRLIKRLFILLCLFVVLAFGVLFTVQNTATAPLDLLVIQLPEQRVALWVVLSFVVGGVLGLLMSSATIMKLKTDALLLQRKLQRSDKELTQLRTNDLRVTLPSSSGTAKGK